VKIQIKNMVALIGTQLHWSDILVLLLYFLLILGFGVWVREIKESSFDDLIVFRVHARIVAVLVRKDIFLFLLFKDLKFFIQVDIFLLVAQCILYR
jgi:hypothetical protein